MTAQALLHELEDAGIRLHRTGSLAARGDCAQRLTRSVSRSPPPNQARRAQGTAATRDRGCGVHSA